MFTVELDCASDKEIRHLTVKSMIRLSTVILKVHPFWKIHSNTIKIIIVLEAAEDAKILLLVL